MRKSLGELINTALSDADSALKLASARDAEIRSSGDFLDAELESYKLAAEDTSSEAETAKEERKEMRKEKKEEASEKKASRSDVLGAASYAMKLAEALEIGAHVVAKVAADTDPSTHEQKVTVSTGGAGATPIKAPGPQVMAGGFINAQTVQPKAQSAGAERIVGPTTTAGNLPTTIADHTGHLDGEQPPNNTGKTAGSNRHLYGITNANQNDLNEFLSDANEDQLLEDPHFDPHGGYKGIHDLRAKYKAYAQGDKKHWYVGSHDLHKKLYGQRAGSSPTTAGFTRSKEASARLLRAKQAQAETLMRMGQIKEAERLLAEVEKAAQDPSSPGPELPAHSNSYMLSTEPGDSTMIPDNSGLISMSKAQAKDRSVRTATEYVDARPKLDNAVAAHSLTTQGQKVSSLIVNAVEAEKVAVSNAWIRKMIRSGANKVNVSHLQKAERAHDALYDAGGTLAKGQKRFVQRKELLRALADQATGSRPPRG
jgi:hypothetical protein